MNTFLNRVLVVISLALLLSGCFQTSGSFKVPSTKDATRMLTGVVTKKATTVAKDTATSAVDGAKSAAKKQPEQTEDKTVCVEDTNTPETECAAVKKPTLWEKTKKLGGKVKAGAVAAKDNLKKQIHKSSAPTE